jgi:hypothetical protein
MHTRPHVSESLAMQHSTSMFDASAMGACPAPCRRLDVGLQLREPEETGLDV